MIQSPLLLQINSFDADLGSGRSNLVPKFDREHVNVVNYEQVSKGSPCPLGY